MRPLAGLALAVFALITGSVSGRAEEKKKPSIEGNYTLVSLEVLGMALPDELLNKMPEADKGFKITADKIIATKGGKEDPANYTIDASKTPHEIDLIAKKKDGKEEKMYGIYKVDGDKLILCLVESDKPTDRPKVFKTGKDGKTMMMVLKKK